MVRALEASQRCAAPARWRSGGRSPRRPRCRPLVGICPPSDLVEVVPDARRPPACARAPRRRAARSRCAPGRATGAPDPTASSLRSAPWRATRHAPRRWRGPSPKRRDRRSPCAPFPLTGVRGGTAPRQPLRWGHRGGVWPRRVGWLPGHERHPTSLVRRRRGRSGSSRRIGLFDALACPALQRGPRVRPCPAAAHQIPGWFAGESAFRARCRAAWRPEAVEPEPCRELGAGEHAATQARQGDPLGPSARQVEPLQRPLAPLRWAGMLRPSSSPWRNVEEPFGRKSTRRKPPKCPYCP